MQSSKEEQGEIRKPSSVINTKKKIDENNKMVKVRDIFKKIRYTKEYFMLRWAQ